MTMHNVTIGDRFKMSSKGVNIFEVVDFFEIKSLVRKEIVGHNCIAKGINTLAKNNFEVPFSTVLRNRIINE